MPETDLYKWFTETEETEEEKKEVDIYDWYEETTEVLEEPAQVDLHDWFKEITPEEIIRPPEPTWWEKGWEKTEDIYAWLYPGGYTQTFINTWAPVLETTSSVIGDAATFLARLCPNQEDLPSYREQSIPRQALTLAQATSVIAVGALMGYTGITAIANLAKSFAYGRADKIAAKIATQHFNKIKAQNPQVKTPADAQALVQASLRGAVAPKVETTYLPTTMAELKKLGEQLLKAPAKSMATEQFKTGIIGQIKTMITEAGREPTSKIMEPFVKAVAHYVGAPLTGIITPEYGAVVTEEIVRDLPIMITGLLDQGRATVQFDKPTIIPEEKIVEEQISQPIPDWAKKEMEEFATEREGKEEYVREMLSMSEGESLLSRIKRRGGIKWTPSARDFGNYNQIPRSAVNRQGIPFDEMADELGMTNDELWESLIAYKSRKATMDEKVSEILKRTAPEVAPRAKLESSLSIGRKLEAHPDDPILLAQQAEAIYNERAEGVGESLTYPEYIADDDLLAAERFWKEKYDSYPEGKVAIDKAKEAKARLAAMKKPEVAPKLAWKEELPIRIPVEGAYMAEFRYEKAPGRAYAEYKGYVIEDAHPRALTSRFHIHDKTGEIVSMQNTLEQAIARIDTLAPKVEIRGEKPAGLPEVEVSEEVKRTEIIEQISSKLGVPIRLGHFRERALGIYKKKPKIIRLKAPIDVPTAAHEIGHYLHDDVFKFDLHGYTEELLPLDPKEKSLEEGYAEFVSRYVIDREKAEELAPKFFNHFEETISSIPEVKEVLDTTKADYERWLSMPAAAKVASQINYEPDKTGGFGFGKLYTMLIDELYPLKKYTDIARQKGLEVKTEEDPFILATLHRGWHGKADSFLRHKTFDANFKWSGEPLTAILQPVVNKDAMKDFDTYLVAKQAIFRLEHDKKVGIDYKDATEALKELEEKHPEFKDLSQRLYDYQDRLLQYARDSGLIGQETYENFSVNLSYVPLHRVIERLGARGVLGKGFANLPSVYKRFKGSEREIIPPTESIVKNTYVIIDAVERNRIAQAMTRLSKLHPELGRAVEKIPGDIAKVATLSEQEIANIVKEQGFELAPKDIEDLINVFRPSMFLPKGNVIKVVEDGKPTYYEVDPDIYRSLTMMDREQMNIMIRLLAYPARMLRIGAVSLSPEFLVRNPARDAFTAFVYSKAGFIPGLDTMRGLFSTVTRDETYWKWKISGGEHSMLTSLDREYLQQDVKVLMKDRIAELKNVVRHPIQSAQILAELGEQATRIGEFKLVMEGGKRWWMLAERPPEAEVERGKVLRAGQAARDVTLDFARLGTKTRAVNQIIAFWNANVQDLDKIRRSFQENPIRTLWKILLGITVPSVALWAVNKDDERVQELPQWQRDLFWIVPTKKRLWRIPKPFTLGIIFGSGAERTLDYIYDQDPEAIKQLGRNVLRGINPGVLPTAFLPAIEAATNYSFFLERPVVSEALKRKIPELQYNPYTTETAKMIGDALDVSPQKVEYFLRGYTGGFGKLAMETSDAIMRSISDTEEPKRPNTLADIPLVRGFVAREPWGSSESISRFYTLYERAEMGTAAIKQMIDERRREKALEYKDKYPEFRYVKMLRKVAAELSALRKKRNAISESDIDAERKLERIEEIEKRMTRIARRAVETMKR